MTPAFWDTSALIPLCVHQKPSPAVRQLIERHSITVWWATSIEMCSAFERLLRMGQLTIPQHAGATERLARLRHSWRELQPTEAVRFQAETFLKRYPLRAADALQLAAAWTWCAGNSQICTFISADAKLLEAARSAGFQSVAV